MRADETFDAISQEAFYGLLVGLSKTIYTSGNAFPLRLRGDDAAAGVMCRLLCFVLCEEKCDSGRAESGVPNP